MLSKCLTHISLCIYIGYLISYKFKLLPHSRCRQFDLELMQRYPFLSNIDVEKERDRSLIKWLKARVSVKLLIVCISNLVV